jgi:hypothetical protein
MTVQELMSELSLCERDSDVEIVIQAPFGLYRITSVSVNREAWPHTTEIVVETFGDSPIERLVNRAKG